MNSGSKRVFTLIGTATGHELHQILRRSNIRVRKHTGKRLGAIPTQIVSRSIEILFHRNNTKTPHA